MERNVINVAVEVQFGINNYTPISYRGLAEFVIKERYFKEWCLLGCYAVWLL
jgi:hypothetical protein